MRSITPPRSLPLSHAGDVLQEFDDLPEIPVSRSAKKVYGSLLRPGKTPRSGGNNRQGEDLRRRICIRSVALLHKHTKIHYISNSDERSAYLRNYTDV